MRVVLTASLLSTMASSALLIHAQVSTSAEVMQASGSWATVATMIVNVGFAGFVGWYLLTKALPKILETFSLSLTELQKGFMERDDKRRTENREATRQVIEHCEREAKRRDELYQSEQTRRDAMFQTEISYVVAAMKDNSEIMENIRNELRMWQQRRQNANQPKKKEGS